MTTQIGARFIELLRQGDFSNTEEALARVHPKNWNALAESVTNLCEEIDSIPMTVWARDLTLHSQSVTNSSQFAGLCLTKYLAGTTLNRYIRLLIEPAYQRAVQLSADMGKDLGNDKNAICEVVTVFLQAFVTHLEDTPAQLRGPLQTEYEKYGRGKEIVCSAWNSSITTVASFLSEPYKIGIEDAISVSLQKLLNDSRAVAEHIVDVKSRPQPEPYGTMLLQHAQTLAQHEEEYFDKENAELLLKTWRCSFTPNARRVDEFVSCIKGIFEDSQSEITSSLSLLVDDMQTSAYINKCNDKKWKKFKQVGEFTLYSGRWTGTACKVECEIEQFEPKDFVRKGIRQWFNFSEAYDPHVNIKNEDSRDIDFCFDLPWPFSPRVFSRSCRPKRSPRLLVYRQTLSI